MRRPMLVKKSFGTRSHFQRVEARKRAAAAAAAAEAAEEAAAALVAARLKRKREIESDDGSDGLLVSGKKTPAVMSQVSTEQSSNAERRVNVCCC